MDGRMNRECIVFDGKKIAVKLFRPKEYYLKRAIAVAVTMLTLILVGAVIGIAFLRGDILRALDGQGGGGEISSPGQNNGVSVGGTVEKYDSEEESESEMVESPGEESIGEDLPPDSAETVEYVVKDMSFSQLGDAYLINYSKLNPDARGLLEMGFKGGKYTYSEAPVVLVLHTHTSEDYADADAQDPLRLLTHSVLTVGERIVYELSRSGVPAVHCTVIHDGEGEDAYANAADTIATMLKIYPSIQYVIDVHRAEELDGNGMPVKSEAPSGDSQIRVTVSSGGQLTEDTLSLALCLRRELNSDDKKLCMPVVLTDSKYNADLSAYYLKIDVGTQSNEVEEAISAASLFAEAFAQTVKK